ncbi:hypothetical protein GCM10010308_75480 [Streptomyces vinaceusdrappus]|nr:hypothetical protein GCM10010301_71470 [Streptomyces plicatus]GHC45248.1 hypothetical protein GCM10010308_75480 [Streptomyces vinaceusdrappus]
MPGDEFDSDHAKTDHGVEYAGDQGSQTPGADTQPAHEAPPGRRRHLTDHRDPQRRVQGENPQGGQGDQQRRSQCAAEERLLASSA